MTGCSYKTLQHRSAKTLLAALAATAIVGHHLLVLRHLGRHVEDCPAEAVTIASVHDDNRSERERGSFNFQFVYSQREMEMIETRGGSVCGRTAEAAMTGEMRRVAGRLTCLLIVMLATICSCTEGMRGGGDGEGGLQETDADAVSGDVTSVDGGVDSGEDTGSVCDRETGKCIECGTEAVGKPPMNGYWYGKGYHFEWSPILERKNWAEKFSVLVDKLGEPAVLGVDLSSGTWPSVRGDTEEAMAIETVAKWVNKNDGKTIYQNDARYVYYVTWLFPGEVRSDLGRAEAYRRAANGDYNSHYRKLAKKFTKHGFADKVIVRLHPEHNGDWQGYAGGGNEENFKKAWRQFARAVRSVDEDIQLAYSPSIHHSKEVTLDAYPGDQYVDYLGLSGIHDGTFPLYEDEQEVCGEDCEYPDCSKACNDKLFEQAWNYYETHEFGLDAAAKFADDHDLPIAFLEWGLKNENKYSGGDNPRFIRAMYDWMVEHNVHFQIEFEAKGKEDWHLAGGHVPKSLAAYQETFKSGAPTDFVAQRRSLSEACTEEDESEQEETSANFVFVTEQTLKRQKQRVQNGKQPWKTAYDNLIDDADNAVGGTRKSVQDDDGEPKFSDLNNRHDYGTAIKMSESARDCALAYWFTGDDSYASCAVEVIHHWALADSTYMKPTVDSEKSCCTIGQHITIPAFLYAASLVGGHAAWQNYDGSKPWESGSESGAEAAFEEWVRDRHQDFIPSRPSFCEYNNKWAWRIADRAATGAYLQNDNYVQQAKEMFQAQRATTCPDGSMRLRPWNDLRNGDGRHAYGNSAKPSENAYFKRELARDIGFTYTAYNLKALVLSPIIFEAYDGSDLWNFNAPQDNYSGSSLSKAFNWFEEYVQDTSAWRWNASGVSIDKGAVREATSAFELAYTHWGGFQNVLQKPDKIGGRPHYDRRLLGHVTLTHGRP